MRRAFLRARGGGVAILTALSMAALFGAAAMASDVGYVFLKARELQGAADLAALSAASDLNRAQRLAESTVRANGWPRGVRVETELGGYAADPALAPAARFSTSHAPNAVRVHLTGEATLFFGRLFVPSGKVRIARSATAARTELAAFEIGSRLLSVRGGIANAVLGGLTGSRVELSVMDYNALIRDDIDLFDYVAALRTRLDLEAASFDETLDARVDADEAIEAIADVLAANGDAASDAVRRIADAARPLGEIDDLARLLDLGPYGGQDVVARTGAARVAVNALNLTNAVLEIAGGARQVRLDLGAQAPGLAQTRVWLAIGERPNGSPWLTVTNDEDVIIRTAQMRLYVEAEIAGALGPLARIRLPVLVEAASAQARLSRIRCGADQPAHQVTLSVAPSVGAVAIADIDRERLDDFRRPLALGPAQFVRTALLRVEGSAHVELGGRRWQDVTFTGDEIARGVVKTVATRDIAEASIASLVSDLDLDVKAAGLGLGVGAITAALGPMLAQAAAPLDNLLNGLTDLLGVHVGEADVRVNGVRCDGAALVA